MIDKNVNTDVELTIELDYDGELPDTNNKHDVMIIEQKKVADLNEKVKKISDIPAHKLDVDY
jgi:hypothetical protein